MDSTNPCQYYIIRICDDIHLEQVKQPKQIFLLSPLQKTYGYMLIKDQFFCVLTKSETEENNIWVIFYIVHILLLHIRERDRERGKKYKQNPIKYG